MGRFRLERGLGIVQACFWRVWHKRGNRIPAQPLCPTWETSLHRPHSAVTTGGKAFIPCPHTGSPCGPALPPAATLRAGRTYIITVLSANVVRAESPRQGRGTWVGPQREACPLPMRVGSAERGRHLALCLGSERLIPGATRRPRERYLLFRLIHALLRSKEMASFLPPADL